MGVSREDALLRLNRLLLQLTGEHVSEVAAVGLSFTPKAIGFSQLNELLLSFGYDRVSPSLFQFLVNGETDYRSGAALPSLDAFEDGVRRFRILCMLMFGNVKFGFKMYSQNQQLLAQDVDLLRPRSKTRFQKRHSAVHPITRISSDQTYLLGYLVERRLKEQLARTPNDPSVLAEEDRRRRVVSIGQLNHVAYLNSDHLDVYVATSMREPHEYVAVAELTSEIFRRRELASLNLRFFDPTQAYCSERLDKGLAEALMLRRAKCTLYLVQETDTLGKDSELASTLAQGKAVVAYVPKVDDRFLERWIGQLRRAYPEKSERVLLLEQLGIFGGAANLKDPRVRRWFDNPSKVRIATLRRFVEARMRDHYDRRAKTLLEDHPLGIQVELTTGVANGVLVVRTIDQCVKLIRQIVLNALQFKLEEKTVEGGKYVLLKEKVSNSVFRVMTGDRQLSNSFWNYYRASTD